jgi:hypothetical protein
MTWSIFLDESRSVRWRFDSSPITLRTSGADVIADAKQYCPGRATFLYDQRMAFLFNPPQELAEPGAGAKSGDNNAAFASSNHRLTLQFN